MEKVMSKSSKLPMFTVELSWPVKGSKVGRETYRAQRIAGHRFNAAEFTFGRDIEPTRNLVWWFDDQSTRDTVAARLRKHYPSVATY